MSKVSRPRKGLCCVCTVKGQNFGSYWWVTEDPVQVWVVVLQMVSTRSERLIDTPERVGCGGVSIQFVEHQNNWFIQLQQNLNTRKRVCRGRWSLPKWSYQVRVGSLKIHKNFWTEFLVDERLLKQFKGSIPFSEGEEIRGNIEHVLKWFQGSMTEYL